jgi:hypothetical protein
VVAVLPSHGLGGLFDLRPVCFAGRGVDRLLVLGGEIIFGTSVYFEEDPNLAAIVSQHRQETLGQPFI